MGTIVRNSSSAHVNEGDSSERQRIAGLFEQRRQRRVDLRAYLIWEADAPLQLAPAVQAPQARADMDPAIADLVERFRAETNTMVAAQRVRDDEVRRMRHRRAVLGARERNTGRRSIAEGRDEVNAAIEADCEAVLWRPGNAVGLVVEPRFEGTSTFQARQHQVVLQVCGGRKMHLSTEV